MSRPAKFALAVAVLAAGAYLAAAGYLYTVQTRMVLPQTVTRMPPPPNPAVTPYQPLSIATPDGATLNGILLPATASPTTLVIAFGGNAHDVVGMAAFLKKDVFPQPTVTVAGLSYRGYPNSLGTPSTGTSSQQALYADSELIYDTLAQRLHPTQVYAVGYSLGTSVAAHLAITRPLAALAFIAPPASVRRLGQQQYPWLPVALLLKNPFPTEDFIGRITAPVTIVYTPTDGLIPASHVAVLHAADPSATVVKLTGSTHATILDNPALPGVLRRALPVSATTPR